MIILVFIVKNILYKKCLFRNITKDSKLCLDSNNGLDEPSFKNFINEIKDCKILFIEQPLRQMPKF
jgi:L-alanine-DL-glutamate epimerase-like enolase superfamily enzyme